ncbi:hypothetical protein O0L34_g10752 [Tuta absoluta]|nr:hypothetical protein O0L34_g10752 [Tuta absoluta]
MTMMMKTLIPDGKSSQEPSDDAAEVAEVTDSLGLLESSFVREDDDGDVDDQETSDHDDDDDEFDPDDESSNQQDHSEDSTHHSETDTSKPQTTTKTVTDKHFGIITNKTDVEVTVTKDTGEAIKKDETAKDVSMDIGETIVQDATDLAEQDANVDQDATEVADQDITSVGEVTTEFTDRDATNNVDQDTTDVVDQGTEDKEFVFEISNVVSQDDGKDAEGIDIDDAIVCGEVEVTENDPDGDQPTEVDVSALQSMPEDNGSNAMPFKVHTESKLRELLNKETAEQVKSPQIPNNTSL